MSTTNVTSLRQPWRVSLHGGHSGEFCDHAEGTLREMLDAAVRAGYHTYGVSEHAPRLAAKFLYPEETALGWTVEKITADFENYVRALTPLAIEFADRITVLRGFECEVVPAERYIDIMSTYRTRRLPNGDPAFDYCVGSVHYVDEQQIDGSPENFADVARSAGGLESLTVRYYETVAAMTRDLRPDIVGHFDLIKKNAAAAGLNPGLVETDRCRAAAAAALEAVQDTGAILDLNMAGWRKGLAAPYPAPWLVRMAAQKGIGFCFGDDSHRTSEVGAGLERAAAYLIENGVLSLSVLTREDPVGSGKIIRRNVALPEAPRVPA